MSKPLLVSASVGVAPRGTPCPWLTAKTQVSVSKTSPHISFALIGFIGAFRKKVDQTDNDTLCAYVKKLQRDHYLIFRQLFLLGLAVRKSPVCDFNPFTLRGEYS